MATIAQQLQQAREAGNLTLEKAADITKIRTDHLRALEEGNYDVFSAPVYIRGFVRTYATLLKMDVPRVMADLVEELGKTSNFAEPPSLTGEPRTVLDRVMLWLSQVDWKKGMIVLGVIAVLGGTTAAVMVWRHNKTSDPLRDLPPATYRPNPGHGGVTLPVPAPAQPPRR
jgi:cytoskeletal protein RodZ